MKVGVTRTDVVSMWLTLRLKGSESDRDSICTHSLPDGGGLDLAHFLRRKGKETIIEILWAVALLKPPTLTPHSLGVQRHGAEAGEGWCDTHGRGLDVTESMSESDRDSIRPHFLSLNEVSM